MTELERAAEAAALGVQRGDSCILMEVTKELTQSALEELPEDDNPEDEASRKGGHEKREQLDEIPEGDIRVDEPSGKDGHENREHLGELRSWLEGTDAERSSLFLLMCSGKYRIRRPSPTH